MGRAVEPILRAGMSDSDPEIRFRSKYLLPLALNYDLEKRIQAFLVDRADKSPLPGWTRFKAAVGDDAKSRDLFAAMHRADTELLELMDKDPSAAQNKIAAHCNEFAMTRNYGYNMPVVAEQVAMLLYAIQDSRMKFDGTARANFSNALHSLSYQPTGKEVLKNNEVIRRLVVKYLSAWTETTIHSDVYLLVNLEIKEGVDIARAMIKKSSTQPWTRAMAMGALAKIGGKNVIPELLPFLEDKSSCGTTTFGFNNRNVTMSTQLRDVALGLLVHLTGQSLNDYDFAYVKVFPANFSTVNLFMSPTLLGFSDQKARRRLAEKMEAVVRQGKGQFTQIENEVSRSTPMTASVGQHSA